MVGSLKSWLEGKYGNFQEKFPFYKLRIGLKTLAVSKVRRLLCTNSGQFYFTLNDAFNDDYHQVFQ